MTTLPAGREPFRPRQAKEVLSAEPIFKILGRPPLPFNPEVADRVCAHVSAGGSIKRFCEQPDNPSWETIWKWISGQNGAPEDFASRYAQAREAQYHGWANEIIDIADEPAKDMAAVTRARLRVDTRKWLLSKLLPKVYGDKLEVSGNVTLSALIEASQSIAAGEDATKLIDVSASASELAAQSQAIDRAR